MPSRKKVSLINIYKLFNGMVLNHHGQIQLSSTHQVTLLSNSSGILVNTMAWYSIECGLQYRQQFHRFWLFYKMNLLGSATNNNNWNIVWLQAFTSDNFNPLISNTLLSEKKTLLDKLFVIGLPHYKVLH